MGDNANVKNEEIAHRLKLFMGISNYAAVKKQLLFSDEFGFDSDEFAHFEQSTDGDVIDYADTFMLEFDNENDWTLIDENTKCNDVLLSFISYSICIDDGRILYFSQSQDGIDQYNDWLRIFHKQVSHLIADELNATNLDTMNDAEWNEIYHIQSINAEIIRLCHHVSMIKICVEGKRDKKSFKNMTISIEYLSDQESKAIMERSD